MLIKNHGFSLVELLAVIIVLSIIILISTPIVVDIVNDVKKDAFRNSSLSLFRIAELYESANNFEKIDSLGINITDKTFPLESSNFISGKVIRNEYDKLEIINVTDGYFCANGNKNNLVIIKANCD